MAGCVQKQSEIQCVQQQIKKIVELAKSVNGEHFISKNSNLKISKNLIRVNLQKRKIRSSKLTTPITVRKLSEFCVCMCVYTHTHIHMYNHIELTTN